MKNVRILSSRWSDYRSAHDCSLRVIGSKGNEMVAVHLIKSYCLPSLLYSCETWHARSDDIRSANVALNNSFRKVFNSFWRESVKPLLMYCWCLPVSVLIHQRRLLFWKKCASSDDSVLRTLALCCRDAVGAVRDLYKLTTHDLVVLPVYIVKQLIWDCFQRTVHT